YIYIYIHRYRLYHDLCKLTVSQQKFSSIFIESYESLVLVYVQNTLHFYYYIKIQQCISNTKHCFVYKNLSSNMAEATAYCCFLVSEMKVSSMGRCIHVGDAKECVE
ncbi:hypothetical protein OTU49_005864, partial [Cherax quadricarinatus]